MLWAMQNPNKVEKMVILNTPLGLKTKLRPELAAYKNRMAFLRPDPKVRNLCGTLSRAATDISRIESTPVPAQCLYQACAYIHKPSHTVHGQGCSLPDEVSQRMLVSKAAKSYACCRKRHLMVPPIMQPAAPIRCSGTLQKVTTLLIRKVILAAWL